MSKIKCPWPVRDKQPSIGLQVHHTLPLSKTKEKSERRSVAPTVIANLTKC